MQRAAKLVSAAAALALTGAGVAGICISSRSPGPESTLQHWVKAISDHQFGVATQYVRDDRFPNKARLIQFYQDESQFPNQTMSSAQILRDTVVNAAERKLEVRFTMKDGSTQTATIDARKFADGWKVYVPSPWKQYLNEPSQPRS